MSVVLYFPDGLGLAEEGREFIDGFAVGGPGGGSGVGGVVITVVVSEGDIVIVLSGGYVGIGKLFGSAVIDDGSVGDGGGIVVGIAYDLGSFIVFGDMEVLYCLDAIEVDLTVGARCGTWDDEVYAGDVIEVGCRFDIRVPVEGLEGRHIDRSSVPFGIDEGIGFVVPPVVLCFTGSGMYDDAQAIGRGVAGVVEFEYGPMAEVRSGFEGQIGTGFAPGFGDGVADAQGG